VGGMKRRRTYLESHRSEGNSYKERRTDGVVDGGLNSVLESGEHGEEWRWVVSEKGVEG